MSNAGTHQHCRELLSNTWGDSLPCAILQHEDAKLVPEVLRQIFDKAHIAKELDQLSLPTFVGISGAVPDGARGSDTNSCFQPRGESSDITRVADECRKIGRQSIRQIVYSLFHPLSVRKQWRHDFLCSLQHPTAVRPLVSVLNCDRTQKLRVFAKPHWQGIDLMEEQSTYNPAIFKSYSNNLVVLLLCDIGRLSRGAPRKDGDQYSRYAYAGTDEGPPVDDTGRTQWSARYQSFLQAHSPSLCELVPILPWGLFFHGIDVLQDDIVAAVVMGRGAHARCELTSEPLAVPQLIGPWLGDAACF